MPKSIDLACAAHLAAQPCVQLRPDCAPNARIFVREDTYTIEKHCIDAFLHLARSLGVRMAEGMETGKSPQAGRRSPPVQGSNARTLGLREAPLRRPVRTTLRAH